MTLATIFAAQSAWSQLTAMKMPAQTAYRLLKYAKRVQAEFDVIEQQRGKLIRAAAGAADNENVSLQPGTPEYAQFVTEFGAVLNTESDLKPTDMTFAALLDVIGKEQSNALSVQALGTLEAFFAGDAE